MWHIANELHQALSIQIILVSGIYSSLVLEYHQTYPLQPLIYRLITKLKRIGTELLTSLEMLLLSGCIIHPSDAVFKSLSISSLLTLVCLNLGALQQWLQQHINKGCQSSV